MTSIGQQIEVTAVTKDGSETTLFPVNRAEDIYVGTLVGGSDKLPGEAPDEILRDTLKNIRGSISSLRNSRDQLVASKAPNNHANADTTYGSSTSTMYGHVKLVDSYDVDERGADYGIGASALSVYSLYMYTKGTFSPILHNWRVSEDSKNFGIGSNGVYGHVKLDDSYSENPMASHGAESGTAASSYALSAGYHAALRYTDEHATILAKKNSHGHVEIRDNNFVTETDEIPEEPSNGIVPSVFSLCRSLASIKALISNVQDSLIENIDGTGVAILATRATSSTYGMIKLSDDYTSDSFNDADSSIGASQKAVQKVYKESARKDHSASYAYLMQSGLADNYRFGHVITSDVYDTLQTGVDSEHHIDHTEAIVATQRALYEGLKSVTPIDHSSEDPLYGIGSYDVYGHVKMVERYENIPTSDWNSRGIVVSAYGTKLMLDDKAPTSHTDANGIYGKGTLGVYGHLRLSDSPTDSTSGVNGVAASAYSLYKGLAGKLDSDHKNLIASTVSRGHVTVSDLWNSPQTPYNSAYYGVTASQYALYMGLSSKAPTIHTSVYGTTYGVGTSDVYGHVKLLDNVKNLTYYTGGSPYGLVPSAYGVSLAIGEKANIHHASSSNIYGLGSVTNYGHVKTVNKNYVTETAPTADTPGETLTSYAIGRIVASLKSLIANIDISSHTNVTATNTMYGHVRVLGGSDTFPTSDALSQGIAASAYFTKTLLDMKAPKAHATTTTTYGVGTVSNYGHVKLTSAYSTNFSSVTGYGLSQGGAYNLWQYVSKLKPVRIYTGWYSLFVGSQFSISFSTISNFVTYAGMIHNLYKTTYAAYTGYKVNTLSYGTQPVYGYLFPARIRFRIEGMIHSPKYNNGYYDSGYGANIRAIFIPFSHEFVIYTGENFSYDGGSQPYTNCNGPIYLNNYLPSSDTRDVYLTVQYSISSKMLYITSSVSGVFISGVYVYND